MILPVQHDCYHTYSKGVTKHKTNIKDWWVKKIFLQYIYLPDPRGAGHVDGFQFMSVCLCLFYYAKLIALQSLGLGIGGLGDDDGL